MQTEMDVRYECRGCGCRWKGTVWGRTTQPLDWCISVPKEFSPCCAITGLEPNPEEETE